MSLLNPISLVSSALGITGTFTRGIRSGIRRLTHAGSTGKGDSVQISDQARLLSGSITPDKLAELLGIAPGPDNRVTMEEITQKIRENLAAFQDRLGKIFSETDIDTSKEIELGLDREGKVVVLNDHPDAARIERIFQDNPELADNFRRISAQQSIIARMEAQA